MPADIFVASTCLRIGFWGYARIGHMCKICFKLANHKRINAITKLAPHTLSAAHKDVLTHTRHWLDEMVVGLNLCPFASSVIARDQVHYAICEAATDAELKQFYLTELQRLLETNEHDIATSLLIFTQGLEDFGDYLDLLDWFEQLLETADLTAHVQLASFHPHYQFEGVDADDLSHFTNRAPYPIIHLLRQDQVSKVLEHVLDPEQIYKDNIKTLREIGRKQIEALCPWGVLPEDR